MIDDIKIASLGHVGDTVEAVVLYVRENDRTTYMMAPSDVELITHISDVLPNMVNNVSRSFLYVIAQYLQ